MNAINQRDEYLEPIEMIHNGNQNEVPNLDEETMLLTRVHGDSRRYFQIILNFLSNALKFTKKDGSITVKLTLL